MREQRFQFGLKAVFIAMTAVATLLGVSRYLFVPEVAFTVLLLFATVLYFAIALVGGYLIHRLLVVLVWLISYRRPPEPRRPVTGDYPMIRRRWFQFSLRSFLFTVTVFAASLGWLGSKIERARKQSESVEAIQSAGGYVLYDWELNPVDLDGDSFVPVPLEGENPYPKWLRDLFAEDLFQNAIVVNFMQGERSFSNNDDGSTDVYDIDWVADKNRLDAIVASLRNLGNIRSVYVGFTHQAIGEEVVDALAKALPQCRIVRVEVYVNTPLSARKGPSVGSPRSVGLELRGFEGLTPRQIDRPETQ